MSTDLLRRITPLKAAFAFGAALLVGLTAELVVRVVRDAAATPSATDPARSELAVCRALVGWRVLWDVAWSANMVLIALSGMAPASEQPEGFGRPRVYAALATAAWVPVGLVLLAATGAQCPRTWDGARGEVLWFGLPSFAGIMLVVLFYEVGRRASK